MTIAIDVETFPIAVGQQLPPFVCLAYARPSGETGLFKRDCEGWLADVLRHETIIGHNVAFDMGSIVATFPSLAPLVFQAYSESRIHCTLKHAQLWDIARGLGVKRKYSLEATGERYDVPVFDKSNPYRSKYHELDNIALELWPRAAIEYPQCDAAGALLLASRIPDVPDIRAQSRHDFWRKLSAAFGVLTDQPRVARWAHALEQKRNALEPQLEAAGFLRWDTAKDEYARNMAVIHEEVTRAYNGNPPRTPTGKAQSSADVCRESESALLHTYADYLGTLGALTREWPMLRSPIVHTRYDMVETGRSSSSSPNLQNLSRDSGSRLCFRPRDGYVYAICDFGKLELCCLGQLCRAMGCGDNLAEAIRKGIDPHQLVSAQILGCHYDDVPSHPDRKKTRLAAKAANFGFPGGAGPTSFVEYARATYGVRVTIGEARRLRAQWRKQWPDVMAYQKTVDRWISGKCRACNRPIADATCPACGTPSEKGTLDHYRSGRIRGGLTYTQACNTLFQGLGADVTNATGWALTLAGFRIAAFVHDEYLIEVPIGSAQDAAREVSRIASEVCRDWLPDSPSEIEPTLATRWVKDDPSYSGGRLVIIDADER